MRLAVDGAVRDFTPIKLFRQDYNLPSSFGVNLFEPKDYTELGSIENAGEELNSVRAAVLNAIQSPCTLTDWMYAAPDIAAVFRHNMLKINTVVHLKEVEIDFAVAGFHDVLQALIYELVRSRASRQPPKPFEAIYAGWLHSSVKLSQTVHLYPYAERVVWEIQILTHVYGRFGMIVRALDGMRYVYDPVLACPAQGYMTTLLGEVAAAIYRAS